MREALLRAALTAGEEDGRLLRLAASRPLGQAKIECGPPWRFGTKEVAFEVRPDGHCGTTIFLARSVGGGQSGSRKRVNVEALAAVFGPAWAARRRAEMRDVVEERAKRTARVLTVPRRKPTTMENRVLIAVGGRLRGWCAPKPGALEEALFRGDPDTVPEREVVSTFVRRRANPRVSGPTRARRPQQRFLKAWWGEEVEVLYAFDLTERGFVDRSSVACHLHLPRQKSAVELIGPGIESALHRLREEVSRRTD